MSIKSAADSTSIEAHFEDGTTATGTHIIACDGSHSSARRILCPDHYENHALPVRFLGVSVSYPVELAQKIYALDPFFIQGGDPQTNTFLWFSFLDTPANNERQDKNTYGCQIMIGWPYEKDSPIDVPESNEGRIKLMKKFADGWAGPFKEVVQSIPPGTDVKEIKLEDWVPHKGKWDSLGGRVTLAGDAAHAMTMCEQS